MNSKKILAIVTARGGSKGLPGKNIKEICGKPLIGWTLESAKKCEYFSKIYVSTDNKEIANVCASFGVEVSEFRPDYLAQDNTPSSDVVSYTLDVLAAQNEVYDYITLLEPTSPLRKSDDLKNAIELALNHDDRDGVVSLGEVHLEHPDIVKCVRNGRICSYIKKSEKVTQRQQLDKAYFPYGVIYLVKTSVFKQRKVFYDENSLPYFIERWQTYEIDDIYDFWCVEAILKNRRALL